MKIEFFCNKDGLLDKRALDGGVYAVDLLKEKPKKVIHLYVGESNCIVKRCGQHLMEFSNNPEYFGIKKEYKDKNDLILRFTVHKPLEEKNGRYNDTYKSKELEAIKELKPLTQNPESGSDRMRHKVTKLKLVEEAMKKKGFIKE